ncbi:hypothetical protein FRB98_006241 [Tulasnella sp. 332]|nr:hypothetical protein FRB98_006241 [Tulasnella sp. 332]
MSYNNGHGEGWHQLTGFGSQFNTAKDQFSQEVFRNSGWKALFPDMVKAESKTNFNGAGPSDLRPVECLTNSKGHLQLTLGIKKDGCSYLLVTTSQLVELVTELKRLPQYTSLHGAPGTAHPQPPWDFLSLSPITFATSDRLEKKFKTYKQKTNKNKRKLGKDTSQANDHYAQKNDGQTSSPAGESRSSFEHSRVLYRALHETDDMSLYLAGWDGKVASITSLAFTTWATNDEIKILDMAWSTITLTASAENRRNASYETTHLRVQEWSSLTRNDKRHDRWVGSGPVDFPGGTQVLAEEDCRHRLFCAIRDIIEKRQDHHDTKPHVIFVHNAVKSRDMLMSCGVEVGSWQVGLSTLLRPERRDSFSHSTRDRIPSGARDGHQRDTRSRSPPPRRNDYGDHDLKDWHHPDDQYGYHKKLEYDPRAYDRSSSYGSSSRDHQQRPLFLSATPAPPSAPPVLKQGINSHRFSGQSIILIDILDLYNAASKRDASESVKTHDRISFRELSMKLGVTDEKEGWCAGADAENIYEAWQSLVGGSAVDERGDELKAQQALAEAATRKKSSGPAAASGGLLDAAEAPGLHGGPVIGEMTFDSDSDDEY